MTTKRRTTMKYFAGIGKTHKNVRRNLRNINKHKDYA